MKQLERWRACDGFCCRVAPLRPVPSEQSETGKDCFFRDPTNPEAGCTAMRDSSVLVQMTDKERAHFDFACTGWPQNADPEHQTFDGRCCWRWKVD